MNKILINKEMVDEWHLGTSQREDKEEEEVEEENVPESKYIFCQAKEAFMKAACKNRNGFVVQQIVDFKREVFGLVNNTTSKKISNRSNYTSMRLFKFKRR